MKVEYLGHACFLLDDGETRMVIDPFLSGNPLAAKSPDEVVVDYVLVSHGHGDHLGDALKIAQQNEAVLCAVVEVAAALFEPEGLKTMVGNIGGRQKTPFGSVKFFPALHGSGVAGALACGFVIELGGKKIYHAGDTGLAAEMQFLKEEELDLALLPIGDFYTMGPEDALRAVELIRPKWVVPMHYNTFPAIKQDPFKFKEEVEKRGLAQVQVLDPGQSLEL